MELRTAHSLVAQVARVQFPSLAKSTYNNQMVFLPHGIRRLAAEMVPDIII